MQIACTNCMVPGRDLTEQANNLRKWGYDAIAIQVRDHERSDELLEQILGLRERTGIAVSEFSFVGGYFSRHMSDDPAIKEKAIQYFYDSFEVCRQIGAVTAIGFEYQARNPLPLFESDNSMPPAVEEEFLRILRQVGTRANEMGVEFAVEAINRYETRHINNLADCRYVIDKVRDTCRVGIVADSFHLAMEEADMADAIRASRGYITVVHLGENNRMIPGYGAINWKAFFGALKEITFGGYASLECGVPGDPSVLLPQCAAYLRKMIAMA